jgi:hypothetical protein
MKITKQHLRRLIKEEILKVVTEASFVEPETHQEWLSWSQTFNLDPEYDYEGQLHFYLYPTALDRDAIAKEAERIGASLETDNEGQTIIYTGVFE